jgi:hypothetical protein
VRKAVLIAVALACLALPASASAVTATFDDLAAGTYVTNQYADLGGPGQGVTFGPLPGGSTGLKPYVTQVPAGQAQSGNQVGMINVCDPNVPCELPPPHTTATFQSGRTSVSVRVGLGGEPAVSDCIPNEGTSCATVTLTARDANGAAIGTPAQAVVKRGQGFKTLLSVELPSPSIRGFTVSAFDDYGEAVGIDDVTFDVPMTPPPPDFTLTPASNFLVMSQGQTLTDRIAIGRTGGSTGDVSFELTGPLPQGVSASFAPNPAGGDFTDLRLTASPDASLTGNGFEPIEVRVTGTPAAASAGPEPRTFPIRLQVRSAFDLSVPQAHVDIAPCVVKVPVSVRRGVGFPGPVTLSATTDEKIPKFSRIGLSFEKEQLTFANGAGSEGTKLVITGPPTGKPVRTSTVTVTAAAAGHPPRTASFTVGGACPARYDAQVTSLEITQGVQSEVIPYRYEDYPESPVGYDEIPNRATLRRDGPTIVRVYANLAFGPAEGVPQVPMLLTGSYRDRIGNRKAHPGSPLAPVSGTRLLGTGPSHPPPDEARSETAVYTFVLPKEWTHTTTSISARVQPSLGGGTRAVTPCDTTECRANDHMGIASIPFIPAHSVTANPLELRYTGATLANPAPEDAFKWTRMAAPLDIRVNPYQAVLDVTDIANERIRCMNNTEPGEPGRDERIACADASNDAAADRVSDWTCDHGKGDDRTWNIGLNTGVAHGRKSSHWCFLDFHLEDDAVVDWNRPLSSVSHEFGHLLGRPHADLLCGGNSNGEEGQSWPPDDRGYLQSRGLTTIMGTGVAGGPFAVIGDQKQWYDFMSYCGSNADSLAQPLNASADQWISVRNWNRILDSHKLTAKRLARPVRAAQGPAVDSLHVSATTDPIATAIHTVEPISSPPQPASQSAYRLVGLDAAGAPVAEVAMLEARVHVDGQPPGLSLDGVIPAANVASVAIVRDAATLASRARSAAAPTVSVTGTPSFGRNATIRWKAADTDGNPLLATVEYSADGGRTFEQIFQGPNRGSARVPARLLPRSSNARVRVTVNDGFLADAATSRRFRSPGAPPAVQIVSPASGLRQPNDAPLALLGQATDDRTRAITGRRLRWAIGRRTIGTGEQIAPARLPAGRHRVDLIARDRAGRTARDSIVVTLTGAKPVFLTLDAPAGAKRSARSLRLRIAASLPSTLTVSGAGGRVQRFAGIGRKSRRVTVRIPRNSSKTLTLRLGLRSGKQVSTRTIRVRRT